MAVIDFQIPARNFELIRDRIGEILATEIATQTLFTDVTVWSERKIPFTNEELPIINILYDTTSYDSKHVGSKQGDNKYSIYAQYALPNTDSATGDVLGSKKAQKLAGVIDYILAYEAFSTLGFALGFIGATIVDNITMGGMQEGDSNHTVTAKIDFTVKGVETTAQLQPLNAEGYTTQVKLNETEFGHKYTLNN